MIERIVFLAADDYEKFARGGGKAADVLKKYLTKEEANNLDSWDKEEVKTTNYITINYCYYY